MPNPKPTQEQIDAARAFMSERTTDFVRAHNPKTAAAIDVLLAATESPSEPTDEQVERATDIAVDHIRTLYPNGMGATREVIRDGIRAVLRSLPPTLPSEEEIARAIEIAYYEAPDGHESFEAEARAVLDLMRSRGAAPPSDEQLAEEAARFADERLGGEPFSSGDVEMIQEEARGGALHKVTKWGHFAVGYFLGRREGRQ